MGEFMTSDGVRLYYEERGTGKPVVFLHGWSGSCKRMERLAESLRDGYRCISYDHRGHGGSAGTDRGLTMKRLGKDLRELLLYLDLREAVLVGHSMGGCVIYSYVSQFGCDRLSRICVIDMSPKVMNDASWEYGIPGYTLERFLRDLETMNDSFPRFFCRFVSRITPSVGKIPPAFGELLGEGLLTGNRPLLLKSLWISMSLADYRPAAAHITVPLLYLHPENGLYPLEAAMYLQEHGAAPVQLATISRAGHAAMIDNPRACIRELRAFLES